MEIINRIVTWVVALILGVMSVVVASQVIYRYILEAPLPWSEELARYLMVWLVLLGAGLGLRAKALIGMEALINVFPAPLKRFAVETVLLFSLLFLAIVFAYGIKLTIMNHAQFSPAMEIPMSLPYAAIPIGALFMIANAILIAMERWRGN
ncbi:MAG: TRAP transporter small permease [Smithellaceae bacterium]|nr:TRAP transporter small permease [Smithellaceae bacterium]